ncbi:alpha/beta hydrolase [Actinotalea sp. M2MS4P-6]|uniref:alpha/beta hydrolase n=1 Tax=Actinotalea sp. M2MS4P-6 TaxID=2983762 RepID=UPI0021E3A167|nr:alpha/beta hydrolase [Actinotalea sp. M2MS4P-6]MCV2394484.1 alpha/beta hydrolase [Actinotalea sp. M2MS4P-6]
MTVDHAVGGLVPVPLDPELARYLARPFTVEPAPDEPAVEVERRRRRTWHDERSAPLPVEVTSQEYAGVVCRRYAARTSPRATLVWLHGGGWVYGEARGDDAMLARFAAEAGIDVVAVDYRLAPEHPFPAALEDAEAVHLALVAQADLPVLVGGASAGANLAVGLSLRLRDAGGPLPAAQFLVCPALDDRGTDEDAGPLTRAVMDEFWAAYLGDAVPDASFAPARSDDLTGLPRTYAFTTSSDPLRLDAWRFATRLAAAGVPVEVVFEPGGYHGFEYEVPEAGFSRRAVDAWVAVLERLAVTAWRDLARDGAGDLAWEVAEPS